MEITRNMERIADVMRDSFLQLKEEGMEPIHINALTMGMIRNSMEKIVGREQAEQWDKAARDSIGWK